MISTNSSTQQRWYHRIACLSLLSLIVLLVLWEIVLAPLRPGGSLMVLKVLPLFFPVSGLLKKKIYTMQWASMFILLYFTEGVVRAMSDVDATSRLLAGLEIFLSVIFFMSTILYVRPFKKMAKTAKATQATQAANATKEK